MERKGTNNTGPDWAQTAEMEFKPSDSSGEHELKWTGIQPNGAALGHHAHDPWFSPQNC